MIGILGTLLAIAIPAVSHMRAQGDRAACGSNLRQLAMATAGYQGENRGQFWRYYVDGDDGRLWWFGLEPGGSGTGTHRPLEKSRSPLAGYLGSVDDQLQCPAFPYEDEAYNPKFDQRAASYGYNIKLGPVPRSQRVTRLSQIAGRAGQIVVFADAVHFDFGSTFNEGHYIYPSPGARQPSGYAHFRHLGVAQYLTADGSVHSQSLEGPSFREVDHAPAGNLTASDGSLDVYEP